MREDECCRLEGGGGFVYTGRNQIPLSLAAFGFGIDASGFFKGNRLETQDRASLLTMQVSRTSAIHQSVEFVHGRRPKDAVIRTWTDCPIPRTLLPYHLCNYHDRLTPFQAGPVPLLAVFAGSRILDHWFLLIVRVRVWVSVHG